MLVPSQVTVGNSAVKLCDVPPGPCSISLTNTGTVAVAVGVTNAVTATNGALIPVNGTVVLPGFSGSRPTSLFGIAASGSNPVGVFISTAS